MKIASSNYFFVIYVNKEKKTTIGWKIMKTDGVKREWCSELEKLRKKLILWNSWLEGVAILINSLTDMEIFYVEIYSASKKASSISTVNSTI